MESRKPIPIPAWLRWREFRCRKLPPIIFAATLLAVIGLWMASVQPPAIVSRAVAQKADVVALVTGSMLSLNVDKYQSVEKGETLALIQPDGVRAELDAFRLRMEFLRNQFDPMVEKKRNAVDYYRLRLEWLEQRVVLAVAKVNLQKAENELSRASQLFQERLISKDQLDLSQKTVEALAAEVTETAKLVSEMETAMEGLQELDVFAAAESEAIAKHLQAGLQSHLENIEQLSQPYTLQAPIAGKISQIRRLPGENVVKGELVFTVTAEESTQLLAYVKHPIRIPIKLGTPVRLQTRGPSRKEASSHVEGIGPEWETLGDSASFAELGASPNLGLPILLALPPELEVRPGEWVDVFLTTH